MRDNKIAIAAATAGVVALVTNQAVAAEPKSGKKGDK